MNQAERPEFVTSVAVRVAKKTIATAPGQKFRSIGVGPITRLRRTRTGATKSAIWAALPNDMLTLRSRWFLRAAEKAAAISAAAPTSATTMKPTKAGVIPK